ncbi:copper-translocating P-type ATPase [Anaeroselena agilis]|uniref:P-type Cu(+) transporter n=1 Tax=Anaeroselena agilis TaxID=3063788 RepID=A0ABU3P3E3_9FIRM|nr:copper-translocating P-type ATPase [Selenomonadales bacterium 4137-cl]
MEHRQHEHGQQTIHHAKDHVEDISTANGASPPSRQGGHKGHHEGMIADFKRRFYVCMAITVPIMALSPMLQHWAGLGESLRFAGDEYFLFALATVLFVYGGLPFLKGAAQEIGQGRPGMMTLVAVAISTAYSYSSFVVFGLAGETFFWELATLVDIMLLGHWIEMKSVMGASQALEKLASLVPADAHLVGADGSITDVPVGSLAKGDVVLVKPGERIPVDAVVLSGETSVDEAMLTGESKPVLKQVAAVVIGGSINGEGAVRIRVEKTGQESFLAQMMELVRQAQESKSRTQDLANRAASWLALGAIFTGGVTMAAWLLSGREVAWAVERAVTVLVISCPHALGLAVPLVVSSSTSLAARQGLLIRDRAAFEAARGIGAVVFDKTGTLTAGKFGVTDVLTLAAGWTREELLRYAASLEQASEHPIAQSIVAAAENLAEAQDFRAIPGKGAEGTVEGRAVKVVSPGYLSEHHIPIHDARLNQLSAAGKTVVFVIVDGEAVGAVALADTIRPESRQAVAALKNLGIRCIMLTGDNKEVARQVAEEVGMDEFIAEVLPQDKVQKIKEIQGRGLVVAMTGDGVNDAPALAQADVGIAVGAGADVAIATADIILIRSNPLDVVDVIKLSRATYRKMVQNLLWATGYNVAAIPLAAGVLYSSGILLSPAVGAMLMSVSTVLVAINARRLKMGEH